MTNSVRWNSNGRFGFTDRPGGPTVFWCRQPIAGTDLYEVGTLNHGRWYRIGAGLRLLSLTECHDLAEQHY